jgi:general secretion pathway protein G
VGHSARGLLSPWAVNPSCRWSPAAQRGVTLIEAGLSASAVAAILGGFLLWSSPNSRVREHDQAERDAAVIAQAAETWTDRGETGCPTISSLAEARYLPADARLDDPWGQRFRIECDSMRFTVWSPGIDQQRGTTDDVRLAVDAE